MQAILGDLRFAFRVLVKNPAVSAIVVTLSVALGANSAIFSIANAVLLRPLPYPSPERLVVFLLSVGAAACYMPARKAASLDPMAALRQD